MRDELPQEIQSLIGQCEAGVTKFTNDQMSTALHFAETMANVVARLDHTFDGVPIICDGMVIYCPKGHGQRLTYNTGRLYCCRGECWSDGCQGDSGSGTVYPFNKCYAELLAIGLDAESNRMTMTQERRDELRRNSERISPQEVRALLDKADSATHLLVSLRKLMHHCYDGAWPGAARRARVNRDLHEALAAIEKANQ